MLVEFSVKNYRSFRDLQVLSLAKAKGKELDDSNAFDPMAPSSVPLLRSSAIYGPNAAGKSNLIKALMAMEDIVLTSASDSQKGDDLPVTPYLFDKESQNSPTEFEIIFISEGVRYQYGFSATQKRIFEEWLIAFPKSRPQRWFSRVFNEKTEKTEYEMGSSFSGKKSLWQSATRENALFLSTAIQLNSEQLAPVYEWFRNTLRMTNIGGWGPGFTASLCEKKEHKDEVLSFLRAADFDIHDVNVEKEKFNPDFLSDAIPQEAKEKIINELKDKEILDIKTIHKTLDDELVSLDFEDESDGTRKFFSFAGPWIDSLKNGYVLIIDELHDSLHPKMVEHLVRLFNNRETNPKNAQLVFTTHETSILNQDVFRRDQIWFCSKDKKHGTELYPLTDFSPRVNRENLEASYLSGRYGALPYVRKISL